LSATRTARAAAAGEAKAEPDSKVVKWLTKGRVVGFFTGHATRKTTQLYDPIYTVELKQD
jgi:hypothetical protein